MISLLAPRLLVQPIDRASARFISSESLLYHSREDALYKKAPMDIGASKRVKLVLMKLPRLYKIVLLLLWIAESLVIYSQYRSQIDKHERIVNNGIYKVVESKIYDGSGTRMIDYVFETDNGQKIRGSRKCGDECSGIGYSMVVYNSDHPEEYELLCDVMAYNPSWKVVFFFILYLPIIAFVTYLIVRSVYRVVNDIPVG